MEIGAVWRRSRCGETREGRGTARAAHERVALVATEGPRAWRFRLWPRYRATLIAAPAALLRALAALIVHGILDSPCGISSARVLRELGVLPCGSLTQADDKLASDRIVFLPVQLLSPAFARILALRGRLGIENTAHLVAQAIDPTRGAAARLTFSVAGTRSEGFDAFAQEIDGDFVALAWAAGRSPLNLSVRPRIERILDGDRELLFEPTHRKRARVPVRRSAAGIARWTTRDDGPVAIPARAQPRRAALRVGRRPHSSLAIAAVTPGLARELRINPLILGFLWRCGWSTDGVLESAR